MPRAKLDMTSLDAQPFALAFSGGGDSLSLLNRLKDHPNLAAVLIVDHGLRERSADEAQRAHSLAARLGHSADILTWSPGRIKTGLQEKARRARYGLMGQACRERGLTRLVTAHHADDQAETVLMRVARGSGWRGAAGMRHSRYAPVWPELAGVSLLRPALSLSRTQLRAGMGELQPIQDPSNRDPQFTRVRTRERLARELALREDMLALSECMMRGLKVERTHIAANINGYDLTEQGRLTLVRPPSLSALCLLAPIIGGQSGPADRQRMSAARERLMDGVSMSLGSGCYAMWVKGHIVLGRDPVAMTGRSDGHLAPSATPTSITTTPRLWDGRFFVSGQGGLIRPTRRKNHVGFTIEDGQNVRVQSLIQDRIDAALRGQ